jgi:hypothetical protein
MDCSYEHHVFVGRMNWSWREREQMNSPINRIIRLEFMAVHKYACHRYFYRISTSHITHDDTKRFLIESSIQSTNVEHVMKYK